MFGFMQISRDDVIGCVELPLTCLSEGHFEGWIKIIVPFTASRKSPFPNLTPSKDPELMLKVDVSVATNKLECGPTESTVEEVVPLAELDERPRREARLHGAIGLEGEFLDHR
jgi:hypothetical protein